MYNYNNIIDKIVAWFNTYSKYHCDSILINGPIATFWASSLYCNGPHLMNSYGIIMGLCHLINNCHCQIYKETLINYANYYIESQDYTTGKFFCGWGETPFIENGLVHQSSAVLALWKVYSLINEKKIYDAAEMGWQACLKDRKLIKLWSVHNQALRATEAMIERANCLDTLTVHNQTKKHINKILKYIERSQNTDISSYFYGSIPQSLSDDSVILVYQGKCIYPLLKIYDYTKDYRALQLATLVADFIIKIIGEIESDIILVPGNFVASGKNYNNFRRLYKFRHLFPFSEKVLRSLRQSSIELFKYSPGPLWIARSADTARGFYHLGKYLKNDFYLKFSKRMLDSILNYQSLSGGIRNTINFMGGELQINSAPVWQDVLPIPRWNSYILQFLIELSNYYPSNFEIKSDINEDVSNLANGVVLVENRRNVLIKSKEGDVLSFLDKQKRWGRPFRNPANWNEGSAVDWSSK